MWLFLSFGYLEALIGLLIGLISILLLCQGIRMLKERGREMGGQPVGGAVRIHTFIDYVCHLIRAHFMAPPNNYHTNIKDQ